MDSLGDRCPGDLELLDERLEDPGLKAWKPFRGTLGKSRYPFKGPLKEDPYCGPPKSQRDPSMRIIPTLGPQADKY